MTVPAPGRGPAPAPPRLRALRPARTAPAGARGPQRGGLRPAAERLLLACGADPAFADAVLGDLVEEYAHRAQHDGVGAARGWYAREVLRSAPHLVRHAVQHAIRHGTAPQRLRLAAVGAGAGFAVAAAALAWLARIGPPARLLPGTAAGAAGDGLVVNSQRPVQLPVRVLDARGHALRPTGVRYTWAGGIAVPVSRTGVVTCTRRGDAVVRATLGPLVTPVRVHCEPVRELRAAFEGDFVLGDSGRDLAADAVGVDGRPVTRLAARLRVEDSTVATLDGERVRPVAAGETVVEMHVGDRRAGALVRVFEPVRTLDAIRPDQRLVAAPVRLPRGASVRWALPRGRFWLSFLAGPVAELAPVLAVDGAVMCMPAIRPGVLDTHCLVRAPGAWVTVANPGVPAGAATAREVVGALAIDRDRDR